MDKELVTIQQLHAFWNMNYHPQTFQSNLPPLNYTSFTTNFTSKLHSLAGAGFPANVPQKVDRQFFFNGGLMQTNVLKANQCPKNQTCEGPNRPVMMLIVCEQVYSSCKAN